MALLVPPCDGAWVAVPGFSTVDINSRNGNVVYRINNPHYCHVYRGCLKICREDQWRISVVVLTHESRQQLQISELLPLWEELAGSFMQLLDENFYCFCFSETAISLCLIILQKNEQWNNYPCWYLHFVSLLENYQLTGGNRGSLGLLWWVEPLEKKMPAMQLEHIGAPSQVTIDA